MKNIPQSKFLIASLMLFSLMSCLPSNSDSEMSEDYIIDRFKYDDFWDLPNDFDNAIKYIVANENRKMSEPAYKKVIVSFPEAFEYDFTKHYDAPEYYTSPDGMLRMYYFYGGWWTNVEVLQFKNSMGKVINKTITAYPLHKLLHDSIPNDVDYKCGRYRASRAVKLLGQIYIDQIATYILFITTEDRDIDYDYREDAYLADEADAYIGGLQLTDNGYKFIPIFENNSSSVVRFEPNHIDPYLIIADRGEHRFDPNPWGWYNKENKTLYVPKYVSHSYVQYEILRWNDKIQRFVSPGVDSIFRKEIKINKFRCPIGWKD